MKKIETKDIKKIQIEILKAFKNICEKNNFEYYLFFGTLLGAIRHKGFIPWDDDIDVIMPRKDYEKFINYCIENENLISPLKIAHYKTRKKYPIAIARLENSDYVITDENDNSFDLGLFVDIYPVDGVGNSIKDVERAAKRVIRWKSCSSMFKNHGFERSRIRIVTKIRYAFYLLYEAIFDYWVSYLDKKTQKKKIEDYSYIGIPCWESSVSHYFDKTLLGKSYCVFEDEEYAIPSGYDAILTQMYHDYMKLPPIEERVPYHFGNVYLRSEFMKENNIAK